VTPEQREFERWLEEQLKYHQDMSKVYKRRAQIAGFFMVFFIVLLGTIFWQTIEPLL